MRRNRLLFCCALAAAVYRQAMRWLGRPGWRVEGDRLIMGVYSFTERDGNLQATFAKTGWPVLAGLTSDEKHQFARAVRKKIEAIKRH
jgi:hypothetical protein